MIPSITANLFDETLVSQSQTLTHCACKDYDDSTGSSEEDSEEDAEADALYRNYEILSDFYKEHFVDLRVLDATCDPEMVPGPDVTNGHVKVIPNSLSGFFLTLCSFHKH